MMDKLADRRMQREQQARFPQPSLSHQGHHGHNHPPLDEDDYDDEEDEEDEEYDSQELEEDDDDMVRTISGDVLSWLIFFSGRSDRGATDGGRPEDVSSFRCQNVRTTSDHSLP